MYLYYCAVLGSIAMLIGQYSLVKYKKCATEVGKDFKNLMSNLVSQPQKTKFYLDKADFWFNFMIVSFTIMLCSDLAMLAIVLNQI